MFNPCLIPNPLCSGQQPESWHDDSDLSTVVVSSGNNISQHNDKSGHGHSRTQTPGANQPETGLDDINGRNAFRYTATNHTYLQAPNYLSFGDYTLFFVAAFDLSSPGVEREPHLISIRKEFGTISSLFSVFTFLLSPGAAFRNIVVRWASGTTGVHTTEVITDGIPALISIRLVRDQAAGLLRVNGVTQLSGFTYAPTEDDQPQIFWGTMFTGANNADFQGKEGENLIYKSAFELHQIEFVENYIKNNYLLW